MENVGFDYECTDDISKNKTVFIGRMDVVCIHCNAKKFRKETHGFCCKNGKVEVPLIPEPPELLKSLLNGLSDKRLRETFIPQIEPKTIEGKFL